MTMHIRMVEAHPGHIEAAHREHEGRHDVQEDWWISMWIDEREHVEDDAFEERFVEMMFMVR